MSFKVILALYLLHKQVHAVRDVTFTEVTGTFEARMLYQKTIESEVECLNICYDQRTCKFVHHFKDNCTLYKYGSIPYLSCEVTYELHRSLRSSFCTFEIPLPQTVNIVPIEKQPDEEVMCNGLPSKLTTIHMYIMSERNLTLYSDSDLVGNFTVAQRLFFAKIPQEHCVAVPVFIGPSECKSRLYFGEVYNTSGYDFLDAYAFTGKCACENSACCGNIEIAEYWVSRIDPDNAYGYFYVNDTIAPTYTFVKESKQQFYIAGEEWLVPLTYVYSL